MKPSPTHGFILSLLFWGLQAVALGEPLKTRKLRPDPPEGFITGVVKGSAKPNYISTGLTGKDRTRITQETMFEIGSITKVFAGILLADSVLSGKAEYDDPVSMHLPKTAVGEDSPFQAITLMNLATHTSGLQRDYYLNKHYPYRAFTKIDKKMLDKVLQGFTSDDLRTPGEYEYSNLGVGILGYALSRIWKKPFGELVAEKICRPLGMTHTFIPNYDELPEGTEQLLATGHTHGKPIRQWNRGELVAAGAIVASAEDMMKFASAHWSGATPKTLAMAMKEAVILRHGKSRAICWKRNGDTISHSGETFGFQSLLKIDLKQQSAFVLLQNSTGNSYHFTTNGNFKDIAGYWSGQIKGHRHTLQIFQYIKPDGRIYSFSLDQGGLWNPASHTERNGDEVTFFFRGINGLFKGVVTGNEMRGTWEQHGLTYTENFKKVERIPDRLVQILNDRFSPAIENVTGYWSGYIGGKQGDFIYFLIEKIEDVFILDLYSPDQNSKPIRVTSAKMSDGELIFEFSKIKATYKGWLSEDSKQIDGLWDQDGSSPLILKWSETVPMRAD